jgi:hypothetical protein
MDPTPIVESLLGIAFLALIFWVPAVILHKAGFARGWTFLIVFSGYLGLVVFAFVEWPIERELGWHRFKAGEDSEAARALAESYAVFLEKAGEWKEAEEVFLELKKRAVSAESVDYYASCLNRLREKTAATELA